MLYNYYFYFLLYLYMLAHYFTYTYMLAHFFISTFISCRNILPQKFLGESYKLFLSLSRFSCAPFSPAEAACSKYFFAVL